MAQKGYFARHGQTQYNVERRLSGHFDIPLTEQGIQQARAAAKNIPTDVTDIYCSDLLRCRQTADILNEGRNVPITYDARLRERDFGALTGKTWDEADPTGEVWQKDEAQAYDYSEHGGENAEGVRARVQECLREIGAKCMGTPLIVTHGGVVRMLHADSGNPQSRIENASITQFMLPQNP